jgi:CRP-like cAMP-binding protein
LRFSGLGDWAERPLLTQSFRHDGNRLLQICPPEDKALLAPLLKTIHLPQGELLQEAGETIENIYFPHSGMISLLVVMRDGGGVEMATIGREGAVNAVAGLGGRISAARAVMQIEGEASQISAAAFRAAVESSASLRDLIVRYNDVHLALLQQTAGCNALHDVENRMSRWLLQTRDRCEDDIVPLTQEFLSEMLGVQRTSVTAIARALQNEGLIRYRRGRIEIVDRAGLEKKSCECYETVRRRSEHMFS